MRKIVLFGLLIGASALFMIGCGDDEECATCPVNTQTATVLGEVGVGSGELEAWILVFALDGGVVTIDSAKVENQLMHIQVGFEGFQYTQCEYEGPAGGLSSGDSVTVQLYAPGGTSTCRLMVLDWNLDQPTGFNYPESSPYDTVAIGTQITLTWNAVANADWYGVYYEYTFDSNGTRAYRTESITQTGTSLVIPASAVQYNGFYYFNVGAAAGPNPETSSGNVTGGVLRGSISSSANESLYIYVGTGDASPSPEQPIPPEDGPTYFENQVKLLR